MILLVDVHINDGASISCSFYFWSILFLDGTVHVCVCMKMRAREKEKKHSINISPLLIRRREGTVPTTSAASRAPYYVPTTSIVHFDTDILHEDFFLV